MLFMSNFTDWLTIELKQRNMSKSDLARDADISNGTLGDIFSGRRPISFDIAYAIARAFNIPPIQVFQTAELLPRDKGKHDPEVEQIIYDLESLSKEEQREVLSYIRWRMNNKKK